jgi:hypothetical protein
MPPMLSFFLSTIAFFVASFFLRRYLEELGIEKGMTRGVVIFLGALVIAYAVAFLVDLVAGG